MTFLNRKLREETSGHVLLGFAIYSMLVMLAFYVVAWAVRGHTLAAYSMLALGIAAAIEALCNFIRLMTLRAQSAFDDWTDEIATKRLEEARSRSEETRERALDAFLGCLEMAYIQGSKDATDLDDSTKLFARNEAAKAFAEERREQMSNLVDCWGDYSREYAYAIAALSKTS